MARHRLYRNVILIGVALLVFVLATSTLQNRPEEQSPGNYPACHVYSHRGASKEAEEHSFRAYDLAISYGSKYIEQDAVTSKDGTLYVSHDMSAARLTGVNRDYSVMTDQEIDGLRTHAGNRILRLSDVFDRYGKSICYVIELKSTDHAAAKAFRDLVEDYGNQDHIILQSYSLDVLEQVDKAFPKMPKMSLCKEQEAFEGSCRIPYVDILSVHKALMTEDNCALAHRSGKQFNAWVLNTRDEIHKAIDLGVDTYFTNDTPLAIAEETNYGKKRRTS